MVPAHSLLRVCFGAKAQMSQLFADHLWSRISFWADAWAVFSYFKPACIQTAVTEEASYYRGRICLCDYTEPDLPEASSGVPSPQWSSPCTQLTAKHRGCKEARSGKSATQSPTSSNVQSATPGSPCRASAGSSQSMKSIQLLINTAALSRRMEAWVSWVHQMDFMISFF